MRRVKKGSIGLIFVISIVVLLFLLGNNMFDDVLRPMSIITPLKEYSTPYVCPSGDRTACNIKGVMECSSKGASNPRVVSRTDNSDFSDGWVAIYDETSQSLQSYCDGGAISSSRIDKSVPVSLPYDVIGYISYGPFNPCITSKCVYIQNNKYNDGTHFFEFEPKSCGADLSPIPKYSCKNQELCEGEIATYSCSGDIRVEKSTTDPTIIIQEQLSYSSNSQPGKDISSQYTINAGNVVFVSGGDRNFVESEVVDVRQECTKNSCTNDKLGVIECLDGIQSQPDYCTGNSICVEDVKVGARCDDPILISSTQYKSAYLLGENIYFLAFLTSQSDSINRASVNIKLLDELGNIIESTGSKDISLSKSSLSQISANFGSKNETGKFKIVLDISFGDNRRVIPEHSYDISVRQPFKLDIRAFGEKSGSVALYTNERILVELRVSEAGRPATLNEINLTVKQGIKVLNNPTYTSSVDELNKVQVYSFLYDLLPTLSEENIKISVIAERLGFTTPLIERSFIVKPAQVVISFTNQDKFINVAPGVYPITFETRTPQGDLIDTRNNITVLIAGVSRDVSGSLVGIGGSYSINFNFDKSTGYIFNVVSSAPNLLGGKASTKVLNIISGGGGVLECTKNEDCGTQQTCSNNICKDKPDKPIFNITIILLIIGAVVLVIIIMRTRRRKQSQVSEGLTGL